LGTDVVDIFDDSTGLWTTAKLSVARAALTATTVGSKAIFAGGYVSQCLGVYTSSDAVDIYDDSTGTWTTAKLSVARQALSSTTVGSKAMFAGGRYNYYTFTSLVDIYDVSTGLWSTDTMPNPRSFLTSTTVGSKALFVGGRGGPGTADVYENPTTTTFCTAKTALVCGPANISATGSPSATATSGFVIKAQPVRGCHAGLLLYSNQPTAAGVSFGGPGDGTLCLSGTGLKRAGPIQTGATPQSCEATLAIDVNRFNTNNWTATGCNPPPGQNNPAGFLSNPGTTVNAQMWGRDSIATGQVLSDGISWTVGP
jgi:hypothetical protein